MAIVTKFKGMRYTPQAGGISELVCPPYDIISEKERGEFLATNPANLIRLELPREGENPYAVAGETLANWLDNGTLAIDEKPAIYIYEEEFTALGETKKIKGINVLVKLEEFSAGVVLPHEETLSKAKEDRFNLMKACSCNFSPIYSLYFDEDGSIYNKVNALSAGKADEEFTDKEGVTHRLWVATDEAVLDAISAGFADKKIYIADGHHRYETALNYRRHLRENGIDAPIGDYVMMTLVNMENDGLVVFPTHRIVRDLEQFNLEATLAKCSEYFDIETLALGDDMEQAISAKLDEKYTEGNIAFALYSGEKNCSLLTLKDNHILEKMLPDRDKSFCELDVAVLHSLVLEKCFGIDKENMANQKNLTYTRSPEEAMTEVDADRANCAFIINPTRVEQIAAVSAAGEKMPQKSTYFYPKIITGMVMNKIK